LPTTASPKRKSREIKNQFHAADQEGQKSKLVFPLSLHTVHEIFYISFLSLTPHAFLSKHQCIVSKKDKNQRAKNEKQKAKVVFGYARQGILSSQYTAQ